MRHWTGFAPTGSPSWTCPSISFAPGPSTPTNSTDWSGNEDDASAVGGSAYLSEIDFIVPAVSPDYNHCDQSLVSLWTGLGGGKASGTLVQTGVQVNAQCGYSNWTNMWWEILPSGPTYVSPFSTGTGDQMFFESYLSGSSTACFFMEDQSKANAAATYCGSYSGSTGQSAEWIAEKISARWSSLTFSDCWAEYNNAGWVSAGAPPHWSIKLITSGGALLASGGAWTDGSYSVFPVIRIANQSQ